MEQREIQLAGGRWQQAEDSKQEADGSGQQAEDKRH